MAIHSMHRLRSLARWGSGPCCQALCSPLSCHLRAASIREPQSQGLGWQLTPQQKVAHNELLKGSKQDTPPGAGRYESLPGAALRGPPRAVGGTKGLRQARDVRRCPGRQSSQVFHLEGMGKAPEGARRQNHPRVGGEGRRTYFGVPAAFTTPEPQGCSPGGPACTSVCRMVEGGPCTFHRWD